LDCDTNTGCTMTTYYTGQEIDVSRTNLLAGATEISTYIPKIFIDLINTVYDNTGSIVDIVLE